jgi:hypothetical protein
MNRRIKSILLAGAVATTAATLLAACGSGGQSNGQSHTTPPTGVVHTSTPTSAPPNPWGPAVTVTGRSGTFRYTLQAGTPVLAPQYLGSSTDAATRELHPAPPPTDYIVVPVKITNPQPDRATLQLSQDIDFAVGVPNALQSALGIDPANCPSGDSSLGLLPPPPLPTGVCLFATSPTTQLTAVASDGSTLTFSEDQPIPAGASATLMLYVTDRGLSSLTDSHYWPNTAPVRSVVLYSMIRGGSDPLNPTATYTPVPLPQG